MVIIYSISGAIMGFAAIVLLSRVGSATPVLGEGFILEGIAVAAIGGYSRRRKRKHTRVLAPDTFDGNYLERP